jgi:uridine kinase
VSIGWAGTDRGAPSPVSRAHVRTYLPARITQSHPSVPMRALASQAMDELGAAVDAIVADLDRWLPGRSMPGHRPLLAISGIDASGKTTVATAVAEALDARGHRCALISLDDWRTPAAVRFDDADPAATFLDHAYRFDDLFNTLLTPLVRDGRIDLAMTRYPSGSNEPESHHVTFAPIDVVLVEGIFLFKAGTRERFDRRYWIDCPEEVALGRALARNQERRSPADLQHDYETIYQPAQRLHVERDDPVACADLVVSSGDG